jgi:hypothetical protein
MSSAGLRLTAGAGLAAAAAARSYPWLFRRPCLTWGARPEEVTRELPGDDLLANPDILATRAISIDAPPATVWPWLVQRATPDPTGRSEIYEHPAGR